MLLVNTPLLHRAFMVMVDSSSRVPYTFWNRGGVVFVSGLAPLARIGSHVYPIINKYEV